jgi:aspartate/methionine/tyrosine aminotransferase
MVSRLVVEAGWYAVLRAPALGPVDAAVVRLLEREQVLVHPGNFYGFSGDGWLVVSLLPPTEEFQEGMARLVRFFGADAEQQK